MKPCLSLALRLALLAAALGFARAAEPVSVSGIYPHLAMFNNEGECGTGAVVPWADRLWVVTYAPHQPKGSSDKLYEITPDLRQIVRPESIGGTPANRMIHAESNQLFIGPHAIDDKGNVRTIPYSDMYGRPTGNARHLTDPAGKIYYATMEEGVYEVDVKTLAVTELWRDEQLKEGRHAGLPGYHGKGLYSTQGRLIYANNGEHGGEAMRNPATPSGVLAEWDGQAAEWTVVRRNQFTEVTGPGGIRGNAKPDDPVWAVGWDHRSLILMLRDGGAWRSFRLPKSSHSYDGAHGWNTEWPRIRDIGEKNFLMTMHGAFWSFPPTFSAANTAGIAPRSNYLKVIGDFARWGDRVVFGCDDTAKSEFLNKRKAKGEIAAPQSQSNLWFVNPADLDGFGPVIGRGGAWVNEDVAAGTASEPFLFSGYARRSLHLAHAGDQAVSIRLEVDADGTGAWKPLRDIAVPARGAQWVELTESGAWVRLVSETALTGATAWFHYANADTRESVPDRMFDPLCGPGEVSADGGIVRPRAENKRTLSLAARNAAGPTGYYELDENLKLTRVDDPTTDAYTREKAAIPAGIITEDAASAIYVDDQGRRFRLPKGDAAFAKDGPLGPSRVCREVATERDLFNAHGTFYELPAENAGGARKMRPVATHNRRIHDFCSYRGLFVMTGLSGIPLQAHPHVIVSDDAKAAVWVGAIDDVWKMGKPRGVGGPWKDTPVKAGAVSDPYLMTAYDEKSVALTQTGAASADLTLEVDVTGDGLWLPYRTFTVPAGETVAHTFPAAFSAYWVRARAAHAGTASVVFTYR